MSNVVMRPLKDGSGYSACNASEDNVGKRRCNHTASTVSFNVEVRKLGGKVQEVVVSDEYEKLDKRDKATVVSKFVQDLEPIEEKKLENILNILRDLD